MECTLVPYLFIFFKGKKLSFAYWRKLGKCFKKAPQNTPNLGHLHLERGTIHPQVDQYLSAMFRQLFSCFSPEIQDVFSPFHLTPCFLFCFVPPLKKVVNKSKVRRTGSRNLEARKHGIPSPSFDYALFSLHFLSICLHIKYSEKNQICLKVTLNFHLPLPSNPHNCLPGDWLGVHVLPALSVHWLDFYFSLHFSIFMI